MRLRFGIVPQKGFEIGKNSKIVSMQGRDESLECYYIGLDGGGRDE